MTRHAARRRIEDVVEAVAKVQPLWALLRVRDRARYMRRMAQAVIDDFDELQEALAREQGRPRAEIAALELLAAIDALIWIARGRRRTCWAAGASGSAARWRSPSARGSRMSHTASWA